MRPVSASVANHYASMLGCAASDVLGLEQWTVWTSKSTSDMAALADGEDMELEGIVSSDSRDLQKEVVKAPGVDLKTYFLKHGWLVDGHTDDTGAKVGYPTSVEEDVSLGNGKRGARLKGKLLPTDRAKDIWKLARALKATGAPRKLAFSIEGPVLKREGADGKTIAKVIVTNVAITANPVNPDCTWDVVSKSLDRVQKAMSAGFPVPSYDGGGNGAALIPQSLEGVGRRRIKLSGPAEDAADRDDDNEEDETMDLSKRFSELSEADQRKALRACGAIEGADEVEKAFDAAMRNVGDHLKKGLPVILDDESAGVFDADTSGVLRNLAKSVDAQRERLDVLSKAVQAVGTLVQRGGNGGGGPEVLAELQRIQARLGLAPARKSIAPGETAERPDPNAGADGDLVDPLRARDMLIKGMKVAERNGELGKATEISNALVALEAGGFRPTKKSLGALGLVA